MRAMRRSVERYRAELKNRYSESETDQARLEKKVQQVKTEQQVRRDSDNNHSGLTTYFTMETVIDHTHHPFLLVSNQILEERLAARRQRIQQFYDVMHKIQMATGVSDMGKLAEEFFSQDVSAARCLGAACLCTLTTSMNV